MKSPELRLGALPPVRVSPGTVLTVAVLALIVHPVLSRGASSPTVAILLSLGIALFMILSVLVHELAHALTARAFGGTVDHIALTLWGGHTQYRGDRVGSLGSTLISLAGPGANLLLAGVCALAAAVAGTGAGSGAGLGSESAGVLFWTFCAYLNMALAVFNLLPGLPMDGGRAVESALGAVLRNRPLGTRITAWTGRVIAAAVIAVPLWRVSGLGASGDGTRGADSTSLITIVWAAVIAMMLWQGASQALRGADVAQRIETMDARSLARRPPLLDPRHPVSSIIGLPDAEETLLLVPAAAAGGEPIARGIDPSALARVPALERDRTPLSAVSRPLGPVGTLSADLRGDALISAMLDAPRAAYLVREEGGALLGVILSAQVNSLLRGR
ncbi:site-2 protease family protein [Brachybacterium sp. DNPG3]